MHPTTTLYLCGPMSLYKNDPEDPWGFKRFARAARSLRGVGYNVISPAENDIDAGFDPNDDPTLFTASDYTRVLLADLTLIASDHIDGVATLTLAHKSRGARAEIAFAEAIGKPVFTDDQWAMRARTTHERTAPEND